VPAGQKMKQSIRINNLLNVLSTLNSCTSSNRAFLCGILQICIRLGSHY